MAPRPSSCGCDQCGARASAAQPFTPDGYCPFCAVRCFPPCGASGGTVTRLCGTLEERRALHAQAAQAPPADAATSAAPPPPRAKRVRTPAVTQEPGSARALVDLAVKHLPDRATRTRVRRALKTADELAPMVLPELERVYRLFRKAIKR